MLQVLVWLWAALNSPIAITIAAIFAGWLITKLIKKAPAWAEWEGSIITAIKWAEKTIPDNTPSAGLQRADAALKWVLAVYAETKKAAAPPDVVAAIKEGIAVLHNHLEMEGALKKAAPIILLCIMLIAPGCSGDAVKAAVDQVRVGVMNQDANVTLALDAYEAEVKASIELVRRDWFRGVIAAGKAQKLEDPKVLEGVEKRYNELEAEKAKKLDEIASLRRTAALNTTGTLQAADLAVKAGYSIGPKSQVDERLNRMETLILQFIQSRVTKQRRRRRRRRGEPSVDDVLKDAITGKALSLASNDPAAEFFGDFDKSLEKLRGRKQIVFSAIDVNSPEFLEMKRTVENCATVWEGIGMVADKILAMAEKYAPLLLA